MIWHYAVWKGSFGYMWPACLSLGEAIVYPPPPFIPLEHGITIVRGNVNCDDCLRMMGLT